MNNYKQNLIHNKTSFLREMLEKRMAICGIRNIARMELFLWDLEMFLQIQSILGDRVVLKGGAAVQFYLPIEYQRTSVDIDMIFCGTKDDIEDTLYKIEQLFGADDEFFKFQQHIPKDPKTTLPLFTYYVPVPSVCTENELRGTEHNKQRIKVEFISHDCDIEIFKAKGNKIFAEESDHDYNVLPINHLFADKLTTLGPNTIGIQDERMDEQIKQLYDIHSLMMFNFNDLDFDVIRKKYLERARLESDNRNIPFDEQFIISNVMSQLDRLSSIDNGSSKELWQYIANFLGLYAGRSANSTPASWAVVGEQLKFLIHLLFVNKSDKRKLERALSIDKILLFESMSGIEKGKKITAFKEKLIREYGHISSIDPKVLKGKNLNRVFWAIVTPDNLDQIEYFINDNVE